MFTQGSTEHLQGDFYAMALRALERLGAAAIFLTGAGQEPLRGLPSHVLQRSYAPLGLAAGVRRLVPRAVSAP
ncbi:rhamnosyltransferase chain B [Pseudomonas aeruginosa]|nr:rhamnosyltransferase chain B [Pseudomonas aeruginosa]